MHFGPIFRALLRSKSRTLLVIGMSALTLAIVVNCLQMILAAREEMQKLSGFDENNLVSLRTVPYSDRFKDEEYLAQVRREDLELLRAQPGVVSVTQTRFLPWIGGGSSWECRAEGSETGYQRMQQYKVGPEIQKTLDVEIVQGRAFTPAETDDPESNVVILSKALADLLWPDESAVGKRVETPDPTYRPLVVGIIDPFYNPYGWPIGDYVMFIAGSRASYDDGLRYLLRLTPEAMANVSFLEELIASRGDGRLASIITVPEAKKRFFSRKEALIQSLGLIIVLMVMVSSIGIFGMTYFAVANRTSQIGTRRALGATRGDILRYFLTENGLLTSVGLALGLGLGFALNIGLVEWFGVEKLEWPLVAFGLIGLWSVSLAAAFFPALRGTRVPPVVATRT